MGEMQSEVTQGAGTQKKVVSHSVKAVTLSNTASYHFCLLISSRNFLKANEKVVANLTFFSIPL